MNKHGKRNCKRCVNNAFWTKSNNNTITIKQNSKHKNHSKAGNWTRILWHRSLECYLSATETTERVDCSQAFNCFNVMGRNIIKQTKPNVRETLFQQSRFFCNI